MPFNYRIPAQARTGPTLRLARGEHELLATGQCARLGVLLPNNTVETAHVDGRPVETRVPYRLAIWLVGGTLILADDASRLLLYCFVIGAERLGAALEALLQHYTANDAVTPSVLRAWLLRKAAQLREADATPFTVTAGCMLVVGGDDDDTDMALVHAASPTRFTPPAAVRHLRGGAERLLLAWPARPGPIRLYRPRTLVCSLVCVGRYRLPRRGSSARVRPCRQLQQR